MIAGQQGRGGIWRQKWKLVFSECYNKNIDEIKFIFIESVFQNVNKVCLADRYIYKYIYVHPLNIQFSLNLNIASRIFFLAVNLAICDKI